MQSRYRVRNWRQFQHYRDRNPPWIKLHFELLSSPDWVMLDDASRVLAVACMLIASRFDGEIPGAEYVQRVAYLNTKPDFNPLIQCGFLEMLADARPETEAYRKETDTFPTGTTPVNGRPLVEVVWSEGLKRLCKLGSLDEKRARSLLGRWRRDAGDVEVMRALDEVERAAISDPVPWLSARLNGKRPDWLPATREEVEGWNLDDVK